MSNTPVARPYQFAAVNATINALNAGHKAPCVVIGTGGGKTIVIALQVAYILKRWPKARVLLLSHVVELIAQDSNALHVFSINHGIFSASLGRKETFADYQVIVAQIQSVHRSREFFDCDFVLVDEVHLINQEAGMYFSFIESCNNFTKNNMRLIGYTATPYRLKDGSIVGANKMLDYEAFNISTEQLQDQGYLKRFTLNLHAEAQVDLSSVGTVAGDYNQGQLSDLMSAHTLVGTHAAFVARVAKKRRTWLAFCVDIAHAEAFADALRALNIPTQAIHSKLDNASREQFLVDFKEGKIRCLVSVATLTTGFDTRLESGEKMVEIDCLISLRPTKSRTLWDQIKGRGTRPVYADGMPIDSVDERIAAIAASTHPNCLLISFCGNPIRFDFAKPKDPSSGKGNGEAPTKTCPKCGNLIHAALRKCNGWIEQDGVECDQEFNIERTNHEKALNLDSPKKGHYPRKLAVQAIYYEKHNKLGKPPMLRVTYQTDGSPADVTEYVLLEHKYSDFAYRKAHAWWAQRCRIPVQTVEEALQYTKNLPRPSHIVVDKDGDWFRIKDFIFQTPN